MKTFISLACACLFLTFSHAQSPNKSLKVPSWTEEDRNFLLQNLMRSKQELIDQTKTLSKEQWNFKESPDRWSINQIVEHIALWEILFMHEISKALARDSDSTYAYAAPDSVFLSENPKNLEGKNAMDYTKPFTYAMPLGNNEGKNNIAWLTKMRDESIEHLKKENKNIRLHYDYCAGPNVHQYFIMIFRHTDRHLRQIKKVKEHAKYPKK